VRRVNRDVLADAATSTWLKYALRDALLRDPVDALNDALVLAALLEAHVREVSDLER
jgi:DNA polymerase III epsilon subunit-like protein